MIHLTDLPLQQRGTEFLVTILINGQKAVMAIDTGSEKSLVRNSVSQRLNMRDHGGEMSTLVGVGGERVTRVVYAEDVNLGEAHGRGLSFLALDDLDEPSDVDGVLGMDFLSNLDLDLDLWGGHFGIYRALDGCDQPRTAMAGPLYTAALAPDSVSDRTLSPEIFVSINGKQLRATFDTGAFHTTLRHSAARRVGLLDGESLADLSVGGFGRRKVAGKVRVSTAVEIGDLTVNNMPVVVLDQSRLGNTDMLLGFDFMIRVHVWISHSSRTLIMQFPPTATPP